MIDTLERNFDYFRQELRDLKTNHAIPVGSLSFYQRTGSATMPSVLLPGLYVRLTIDIGEPANPYCQIFIRDSLDASYWTSNQEQSIEEGGTIIQYYVGVSGGRTYEVTAVSTSGFSLIVKEYEEGDWIGEES